MAQAFRSRVIVWSVFRTHRFRSPLSHAEFTERLRAIVFKPGFWGAFQGRLYGKVGEDAFDIWSPGGVRSTATRILGKLEPGIQPTEGTLRQVPLPSAVALVLLICLVAVEGQLAAALWVRIGLPIVALVTVANVGWQSRVEWRYVTQRLQAELQITMD